MYRRAAAWFSTEMVMGVAVDCLLCKKLTLCTVCSSGEIFLTAISQPEGQDSRERDQGSRKVLSPGGICQNVVMQSAEI